MKRKKIYVCMVCGKRSNDQFGDKPIDRGWDVSCSMTSFECYEDECVLGEDGRVIDIKKRGTHE